MARYSTVGFTPLQQAARQAHRALLHIDSGSFESATQIPVGDAPVGFELFPTRGMEIMIDDLIAKR